MNPLDVALSRRSRTTFTLIGCGVLAVVTAVSLAGVTPSHEASHSYTATFGRAGQGLDPRSLVKVRGISVGGVQEVTLDSHGRAVVKFRVNRDVRVPSSAVAGIEPLSVFGPKDLTLDLGSGEGTGPYLPPGGSIAQTRDPAELADTGRPIYELTSAIDPDELATVIHSLAGGLRGNGAKLRRVTDNTAVLLGLAYGNRHATRRLLGDSAALTGTVADRTEGLDALLRGGDTLAGTLTEKPENFETTLDNASRLSAGASRLLRAHGDDVGLLIDRASGLATTLYIDRAKLWPLLEGLNSFFGGLVGIMRIRGPQNTLQGAANAYLSLNICTTLIDLCPRSWTSSQDDQTPADSAQPPGDRRKGARP